MAFQISSQLSYGVSCPSTVLLNLHALSTKRQKLKKEKLVLTPNLKWEEFPLETGHNRYIRLETGTVPELTLSYTATVEIKPVVVAATRSARWRWRNCTSRRSRICSRAATASPTGWGGWR